jgi:nucleoside-diphosphate-sugar epimerase
VLVDVTKDDSWLEALSKVDAVVHLVGRTHVLHDRASDPLGAYRSVNVDGTQRVLKACIEASVPRFIYLSSIKAVGEGAQSPYSEMSPCNPEDAYGITKREAEIAVLEMASKTDLHVSIVRPPLVYGPGVKGNFLRILQLVDRGIPFPLGCTHNGRSMVFVGNLTSAVAALLDQSSMTENIFHVVDDGEPLSTKELVTRLGHLLGRKVHHIPVPISLLRLGGGLLGHAGEVMRLVSSLTVSGERVKEALDWTPPYTVEEGLAETVNWYRTTLSKRKTS